MVGVEHDDFLKLQNNNMRADMLRARVVCDDGFSFSCQANNTSYCSPRVSGLKAEEYESWEIGFLSEDDELIRKYADACDDSWEDDWVYGYVPTNEVVRLVEKHGGILKSHFPHIF